jgi:NAD(P)-dependent dehydrogenase (short-subunit alcohol dehydrogenase family)
VSGPGRARSQAPAGPLRLLITVDKPLDGRVALVTGGGGGIGTAASLELARQGALVVVADPGVSVEGEPLDEPTAAATAARIQAQGGAAESSTVSVTDHDGLRALLESVRDRYGSLDVVVNTAGIVRSRKLPDTVEDDWLAVFGVHFDGYLNVLRAALPMMVAAGYGRVVGVTSGVGLARTAPDAMVYGAAKRAVAALTWELGPLLPAGIGVNALSPIAATRMVRSSLIASGANPRGLDLSAMPQPEAMAPAAAYLAGDRVGWCRGQVIFSAGSELSPISPPRLLEAVRTDGVENVDRLLDTVMPVVLSPAEAHQRTGGGSNPRFGDVFSGSPSPTPGSDSDRNCLVVADDPVFGGAVARALPAWGMKPVGPGGGDPATGSSRHLQLTFDAVAAALRVAAAAAGPLDSLIVVSNLRSLAGPVDGMSWLHLLEARASTTGDVMAQGAWLRAAARYAREAQRSLRVVHVTVVASDEGCPTAQAVAQLARSANDVRMPESLQAFSVTVESMRDCDIAAAGHLAARLAGTEDAAALAGAELVVGYGWLGVRSHPEPAASLSFGGPAIPPFIDDALRLALG